jgi:hypothetical protein
VDFPSSSLCGYLYIWGLTDDLPLITTYFDVEIIGSRYGFLTQNWGATEQEDILEWQRFPPFKHVTHLLERPYLTMNSNMDQCVVFMRLKERFLVPDHHVHVNGVSFAGQSRMPLTQPCCI